jgi:hypothetical protein
MAILLVQNTIRAGSQRPEWTESLLSHARAALCARSIPMGRDPDP